MYNEHYNLGYSDVLSTTGVIMQKPIRFTQSEWKAYRDGVKQAEYDLRNDQDKFDH